MIFFENRCTLFGIMLLGKSMQISGRTGAWRRPILTGRGDNSISVGSGYEVTGEPMARLRPAMMARNSLAKHLPYGSWHHFRSILELQTPSDPVIGSYAPTQTVLQTFYTYFTQCLVCQAIMTSHISGIRTHNTWFSASLRLCGSIISWRLSVLAVS